MKIFNKGLMMMMMTTTTMMMMGCLSWLRFRAKPRHLPYIYIHMSIPKMSTIFNNELSKSRIFQVVTFRDLHYRFSSP